VNLPDIDLAYFPEHTEHFDDYVEAVEWAQDYARRNRDLMMEQIVGAVRNSGKVPPSSARQVSSSISVRLPGMASAMGPLDGSPPLTAMIPRRAPPLGLSGTVHFCKLAPRAPE